MYRRLEKCYLVGKHVIERIEKAKSILKDKKAFYKYDRNLFACSIINLAFEMVSIAYNPFSISYGDCSFGHISKAYSKDVYSTVYNKELNIFIEIYKEHILPLIFKNKPKFVGISITFLNQIIPGLTLSRLIKEHDPDIHITIGGNYFTRISNTLSQAKVLFKLFDSIIIYEGELPLLTLLECLENSKNLKNVPNLIYKKRNKIIYNKTSAPFSSVFFVTPNFDGLPFDLYLSPDLIIPLLGSRGCYWNKCAFCDHPFGYQGNYRPRASKQIVDDIEKLSKKYNTKHFFFADECISPKMCREISNEIIKRKLGIKWASEIRCERAFNKELIKLMAYSGYRMAVIGIESISDRVLQLMKKGIFSKYIRIIIKNFAEMDIWNHCFFFFGFPGEKTYEIKKTIEFILTNTDILHSVGVGIFSLGIKSKVFEDLNRYNIGIKKDKDDMASYYNHYYLSNDQSLSNIKHIHNRFKKIYAQLPNAKMYNLGPREVFFLYSCKHGANKTIETIKDNLNINSNPPSNRKKCISLRYADSIYWGKPIESREISKNEKNFFRKFPLYDLKHHIEIQLDSKFYPVLEKIKKNKNVSLNKLRLFNTCN